MSDIELVKTCAEAMRIALYVVSQNAPHHTLRTANHENYWPLTNDAQAMALVKRFPREALKALIREFNSRPQSFAEKANRAIVECVAKLKGTP